MTQATVLSGKFRDEVPYVCTDLRIHTGCHQL